MHADTIRREALAELLALPDPPDLRRGFRVTVEGRPDRYRQIPYLASVFIQTRLLEIREREAFKSDAISSFAGQRRPAALRLTTSSVRWSVRSDAA